MRGYLSTDIICSKNGTVFRERGSRKTASSKEQIMFKDKYLSIDSLEFEAIVFTSYILLDVLVCSIAVYFYESCSILASPKGESKYKWWVATFRLHTAIHQAMRSTGYVKPYKALCSAVVGWFSTAVIGAFRSSLFRWVVLSAVRFFAALLLLRFLIVGSHASSRSFQVGNYARIAFSTAKGPCRPD